MTRVIAERCRYPTRISNCTDRVVVAVSPGGVVGRTNYCWDNLLLWRVLGLQPAVPS